jgi:hypothetical protein
VGTGLFNPALSNGALSVVSDRESGLAAGVNDTFRQMASAESGRIWAINETPGQERSAVRTVGLKTVSGSPFRGRYENVFPGSS